MTLSKAERFGLALLFIVFTWFTWRGMTMHYSGDDMMNMYFAWSVQPWLLGKSVVMFWIPVYRPLVGALYRLLYEVIGFHPTPVNVLSWLTLALNVFLGYRFFKVIVGNAGAAFVGLALTLVHPMFSDLYISAGTMYDHFWYLFTVLGITCYALWRRSERGLTLPRQGLLVLICILCMASKESGVALPVLLGLYEVIFHYPGWEHVGTWVRTRGPLFAVLAVISLVDIWRVKITPEIAITAAYQPHASLGVWLEHTGQYFAILSAHHLTFSSAITAAILIGMALIALLIRSRVALFGVAVFVITITPVALISLRPGYVLYVPEIGLGLWFAAIFVVVTNRLPRYRPAFAAIIALLAVWFFQSNWPPAFDPRIAPEFRLTEQFEREYPKMRAGAKLLFVQDDFPSQAWDLAFNLRLMYHDKSLVVHRLIAPPDQQPPDRNRLEGYDFVFTTGAGKYVELDRKNIPESIRLNILANYAVGREMDISRRDYGAHVVSGLMDGDSPDPSRWTEPKSRYKFDVYPEPARIHAKFWVPDFVVKSGEREMAIVVNEHEVGRILLKKDGMNDVLFPVPADAISRPGDFTLVDLNVNNPWIDPSGKAFGIILLNLGFEYNRATIK